MERQSLESCVSFHLSAHVPPLHRGAPGTRIYSAEHAAIFFFSLSLRVLPVPPLKACFAQREGAAAQAEVLSCRFLPAGPPQPSSASRNRSILHWSRCPRSRGIICADSCSIRLETLASARSLPLPPQPFPLLPPLSGDTAHPGGVGTARLNGCPRAAACRLMFSQ